MPFRHLVLALSLWTAAAAQDFYSVPGVDAPELAARGRSAVGVRTIDIVHPGQVDILHLDKATGKAPLYDRLLKIEVWYPAILPPGSQERAVYDSNMPVKAEGAPRTFQCPGKALRDAAPVAGERFPLVVVSHGYPGTLLSRASDQMFTIEALEARSRHANDFLSGALDASRVAIIGYSMGGYGALASAGAGYSKQGEAARQMPGGYLETWTAGNPVFEGRRRDNPKALVAIAPWGAQPPRNNWDAEGLAGIRIPSLFIVGDRDDTSGYEQSVKKAFDGAVNSERYMLVYENARHNVGGNPPPPEALGSFVERAFFDEPVWRIDRIAGINQHFVTAFWTFT